MSVIIVWSFRVFSTWLVRSLSCTFVPSMLTILVARICTEFTVRETKRTGMSKRVSLANERRVRCAVARWGNDDVCAQRLGFASVARNLATRDAASSSTVKESRKQIFIHVYWGAELVKLLLRDICANVARRISRYHLSAREHGCRFLTSNNK